MTTLISKPLNEDTRSPGPLSAGLRIPSSTEDLPISCVFGFLVRQTCAEVTFVGAIDPQRQWRRAATWLASQARPTLSRQSNRPYHTPRRSQLLQPGAPFDLATR